MPAGTGAPNDLSDSSQLLKQLQFINCSLTTAKGINSRAIETPDLVLSTSIAGFRLFSIFSPRSRLADVLWFKISLPF